MNQANYQANLNLRLGPNLLNSSELNIIVKALNAKLKGNKGFEFLLASFFIQNLFKSPFYQHNPVVYKAKFFNESDMSKVLSKNRNDALINNYGLIPRTIFGIRRNNNLL